MWPRLSLPSPARNDSGSVCDLLKQHACLFCQFGNCVMTGFVKGSRNDREPPALLFPCYRRAASTCRPAAQPAAHIVYTADA